MTENKKDQGNFGKTILADALWALGALPLPFLVAPSLLKVMKDYNEYTSDDVDLKRYYDVQKKISEETKKQSQNQKTKSQSQNQSQEVKEEKKKEKDKNRSEELIKIIVTIVLGIVVLYVVLKRLKK